MAWTTYNGGGGGLAAPYFPVAQEFVAGIPARGKGNLYTPQRGAGEGAQKTVYPGGTLIGSARGAGLTFVSRRSVAR